MSVECAYHLHCFAIQLTKHSKLEIVLQINRIVFYLLCVFVYRTKKPLHFYAVELENICENKEHIEVTKEFQPLEMHDNNI